MQPDRHTNRLPVLVLCLSLVLNVALAVAALRLPAKPVAPEAPRPALAADLMETQEVVTELPAEVVYATNRFHWRQLESTNFEEYAANLRSVGCPQKTVADILLADIEETYENQRLAVENGGSFWAAGRQRVAARRAQASAAAALTQQERTLIQRVLGIEWNPGEDILRDGELLGQALGRFILGPMPEETLRLAVTRLQKMETMENEFKQDRNGILTDDDEAEFDLSRQKLWNDLLDRMGPSLSTEMIARMASLQLIDRDLPNPEILGVTPAELRRIALAEAESHGPMALLDWSHGETEEERAQQQAAFTNAVAGIVGAARFPDFERARDPQFREIFDVTQKAKRSKEVAIEVYDMRRLTLEEAGRIAGDPSLDDAARRQQFDQLQAQVQKAVRDALGDTAYREYLAQNGRWVTNALRP